MKKYIVLFALVSNFVMAAPKPECLPYVWGGPTPTNCVTIISPNPSLNKIDLLEWMTASPNKRGTFAMEPGHAVNHVFDNKIIYTKFNDLGDYADVWTFDEDYIYFYATYGTIVPGKFRGAKANLQTDDPLLPRYAQLGYPGVILISEGANFQEIIDCSVGPVIPSTNTITELWGPYTLPEPAYLGDSGFNYISMQSYWDCHGTDHNSCTQMEDYWYMQPYGWINWTAYEAVNRDGKFVKVNGGQVWGPHPGGSVLPDWCLSPSLFAIDPPKRKPINNWPFSPVRLRIR